jgi:exodeoxyribonuclease-3
MGGAHIGSRCKLAAEAGVKIATWNVNGIRAREGEVRDWLARERPEVACLQEIKAPAGKVPASLTGLDGYWSFWHGETAYSGVGLLVRQDLAPDRPAFGHPDFDRETRVVTAEVGGLTVASIYVPNGGRDFDAKMQFLAALERWVAERHAAGRSLLLCGDLNVTRSDLDVHPRERQPAAIGQRPEERAALERILARGLADVGRSLDPANDQLFTWWAPWRNLRQRNIGWRIDYVLASEAVARRASRCAVAAETGTSDHAPVTAVFD